MFAHSHCTFVLLIILIARFFPSACEVRTVEKLNDIKEFKKLLRVRTNVLVLFTDSSLGSSEVKVMNNVVYEAARLAVGQGILATVDCHSQDGKKLCKKLKIPPLAVVLKHYYNGEFHKDYDRLPTARSMFRFLIDPTGDIPWDEDPRAASVVHLDDKTALRKTIAKGKPVLVMFYAPWCGHCKRLKPEFSSAAVELEGEVILAGMDLTQPGNDEISHQYKVEGYPTLEYFDGGKHKFRYSGENTKQGIITWLKNPVEKPVMREPEADEVPWPDVPSEVVHLTDETFDAFVASRKSVLVMFYAPWCGHCKKSKPEYMRAAGRLKSDGIDAALTAVDATVHRAVAEKHNVEGFPTFCYYKDGKFQWRINERTEDGFYNFMKNPKEPEQPELPWSEQPGSVLHLTAANFKPELKKKKNAMVMFYAPWCGYCKKAKPFFTEAAEKLADDSRIAFAAVDCSTQSPLCQEYGVKGYPTIILLSYGKNRIDYSGNHDTSSFMDFVASGGQPSVAAKPPQQAPPLEFGDSVKTGSSENFDEIITSSKAFVMFYAPWCPHCKAAKPAFSEAAESIKSGSFIAVDCTRQEEICEKYGVQSYPTFKVFVGGLPQNYSGARTKEAFVEIFDEKAASGKTEL